MKSKCDNCQKWKDLNEQLHQKIAGLQLTIKALEVLKEDRVEEATGSIDAQGVNQAPDVGDPVQYISNDGGLLPATVLRVHEELKPNMPGTWERRCDLLVSAGDISMNREYKGTENPFEPRSRQSYTWVVSAVPKLKDTRQGNHWRFLPHTGRV